MKILDEQCSQENDTPGWREYNTATRLLGDIRRAPNSLLMTQCLILKCTYLIYAADPDSACDVVCQAVRLCYQNHLNDQRNWQHHSPFDVHMWQRTFWCLFCVERIITLTCGVPYLIRENDIRVDLPAVHDEPIRQPVQLEEFPLQLFMPYLHRMVQLAQLSSTLWDEIYGVKATQPIAEDSIASLDARLQKLAEAAPQNASQNSGMHSFDQYPGSLTCLHNQEMIIRLVSWYTDLIWTYLGLIILPQNTNHLRLLLWRRNLMHFPTQRKHCEKVLAIASESIETMGNHYNSIFYIPSNRHAYVQYITGTLVPLGSIALSMEATSENRSDAVRSFKRGVGILRTIASGLKSARQTLTSLHKIIRGVEEINIENLNPSIQICSLGDSELNSVLSQSSNGAPNLPTNYDSFFDCFNTSTLNSLDTLLFESPFESTFE